MDHPNIAKVFDAGSTEILAAYFVMELVAESRSPSTATRTICPSGNAWNCSSKSARPSSTHTRKGSSIGT